MIPSIRPIAPSEYDAAARLISATFQECVATSMEPHGIKAFLDYSTSEAIRSRDTSGCVTYVALKENQLVGVLHIKNGDHISLLFVRPEFQGNGIGYALIQTADQAKILATVHSSVSAVRSYERYGFKVSGPEQVSEGIRFVPMQRHVG